MSYYESVRIISLPAAGDLSTKQYYALAVNDVGRVAVAGDGVSAVGILCNKPTAIDDVAAIAYDGKVKAIAGATFNAGVELASNAEGKLITATSGERILGIAVEPGVDNRIVTVLLKSFGRIA